VGQQSAEIVQSMIYSAANRTSGTLATIIGIGTLLLTATGTFSEIQMSLNAIWTAEASSNVSQLVRARLLSLSLVVTLGFLMLVSLVVSAALTALGNYLNSFLQAGQLVMSAVSFTISLTLMRFYSLQSTKSCPTSQSPGATSRSVPLSRAQVFLLGAEFTRAYAERHGSHVRERKVDIRPNAALQPKADAHL
jgi:uncharacterized BrkB/YihY/UPF0761 family membrane protein